MGYAERLVPGLRDPDPWVRERVAHALKALEDPGATMPLVEALGDPCQEVRRAAAWALQSVGDERALPALVKALREGDDTVRLWAAAGLERIGDVSCVDALIGALSDSYESVRRYAIQALARIGDRRAVEPLKGALEDEYVRRAALEVLRDTFEVEIQSDYEEARRSLKEYSHEQMCLNEKMETVLNVIIEIEQSTGTVRDEKLYQKLAIKHEIEEDEGLDILVQLMKQGLIDSLNNGYRISV